jgi:hypothetical protein
MEILVLMLAENERCPIIKARQRQFFRTPKPTNESWGDGAAGLRLC